MPPVTLAFVGDIMLGRLVDQEIPTRPPESFWGDVLPVLRGADAVFGNLECAVSDRGTAGARIDKVFAFRARPAAVEILRAAGIRCLSLANNHVLDYGDDALADTLAHLDAARIAHAGAGANLEAAAAPAIVEAGGTKFGFLAITDNEPDFAATAKRSGTFYLPISTNPPVLESLCARIGQARRAGADFVILSAHWGPNMVDTPPRQFRKFARAAVDSGISVFFGHSAHLFQGVEYHGNGLILYDTGDFLDDYAVDPDLRNDWSFVFLVELDGRGPRRLRLIPVRLRFARVDRARPREAEAIARLMIVRCERLGVRPVATPEGLELPRPPA